MPPTETDRRPFDSLVTSRHPSHDSQKNWIFQWEIGFTWLWHQPKNYSTAFNPDARLNGQTERHGQAEVGFFFEHLAFVRTQQTRWKPFLNTNWSTFCWVEPFRAALSPVGFRKASLN